MAKPGRGGRHGGPGDTPSRQKGDPSGEKGGSSRRSSRQAPGAKAISRAAQVSFKPGKSAKRTAGKAPSRKRVPGSGTGSGKKSLPSWLRKRFEQGRQFNRANWHRYPHNEVHLKSGKIVDSYRPGREIVERKYSQLSKVSPKTAKSYIDSLRQKYAPGETISDSAKNRAEGIAGTKLKGKHILEVPVQKYPVPDEVLEHAAKHKVVIRDDHGLVYRKK
jgi:hypothetical protein